MAITDTRKATISLGLDPKGMDAGEREAKKKLLGLVNVKGLAGKVAIGGMVGNVMTAGLGKLTDGFMSVAGEVLEFEKALTRLQIAGGLSARDIGGMRTKINEISKATSVSRNDILAGAAAYQRLTGDTQGARDTMADFASIAVATGANMEDIAKTAASLKDNLKINPGAFRTAFDVLITQGKAGAIELDELAKLMANVAPTFSKFKGGTGVSGMSQLGSALQVAKQDFGTAAEATTGLRAFTVAIQRNAKKFGVKRIFEVDSKGVTKLRDFRSIVEDIAKSNIAGDSTKLVQAFGSDEAKRFFDVISQNLGKYDELLRDSKNSDAVNKDKAAYLASTAGKLELAVNAAKMAIAEAFTPERIAAFTEALGKAASYFADIVGYASKIHGWVTGEKFEWEKTEEALTAKRYDVEGRRQALAFAKYGEKYLSKTGTGGRYATSAYAKTKEALAERGAGTVTMEGADLWRRLTPEQKAEIQRDVQTEGMVAAAMGGQLGTGNVNKYRQLFGGAQYGTKELFGMSGFVKGASDQKFFVDLQAKAIAKAMAAEMQTLRINLENSADGTAESSTNAPKRRKKKGGK